jgi:F-type H+-transporting ATPase subunit b
MQEPHNETIKDKKTGMPAWVFYILGIAVIAVGVFVKGQPWTTPEMFAGLGLDLGKTIINIGFFLFWIQIIRGYFYQPLADSMRERESELESTFSEAEDLRSKMTLMKSEYEARLVATEAEAREEIQSQIREAQDLRQKLMAEASAKADELMEKATQEIEQEKQRVLMDLRVRAVDMTLSAAEKLIGENMDTERNRKLVDEFIEKVEVSS